MEIETELVALRFSQCEHGGSFGFFENHCSLLSPLPMWKNGSKAGFVFIDSARLVGKRLGATAGPLPHSTMRDRECRMCPSSSTMWTVVSTTRSRPTFSTGSFEDDAVDSAFLLNHAVLSSMGAGRTGAGHDFFAASSSRLASIHALKRLG